MARQFTKAALRKEIKTKLSQLSREEKAEQSQVIATKLHNHKVFQESNRISVYLSTVDEVSTTEKILKWLFELHKACFIPRYQGNVMDMVRLDSMDDYNTLPVTQWNIKQPCLEDPRENALDAGGLDLIIVPGLAFTREGHRLGRGKGFYDKYLNAVKELQDKGPYTIGLAFREQLVAHIPTDEHDVLLDDVLFAK